jgi:hypothetical protein
MPRGGRDARAPEMLDRFSADTRRLRQRLEADPLDTRDLKQTVSRMLEDARRTNGAPRGERATFRGEQDTWQRIVDILSRTQDLL